MTLLTTFVKALPDNTVLLVFLLVLLLSTWYLLLPRNLPPGPRTYPIIGNFLDVLEQRPPFHLTLMGYKRRFGSIFRLYFGFHPVIVLGHSDLVREALVEKADVFSNRPSWMHLTQKVSKSAGVIHNIKSWPLTRKFAISSMRDFGVGKSKIEQRCRDEIDVITEEFNGFGGKPFNCQLLITNAVSNIICGVVFNKRFQYNEKDFECVMKILNKLLRSNISYSWTNMYPYVANIFLFFNKGQSNKLRAYNQTLTDFIDENVEQHKATFDPDNIRDFTDIYIASTLGIGEHSNMSKEDAFRTILDMFGAGTETTSTTLQWLLIYLMYNTTVQDKCREEILEVIGTERAPTMADRGKLVYTEATLLEVQRIATIVPLALPHTATRDVTVGGYTVPKDALVIPFIYGCHRDHETWGDPDNFRPERWIDENGKIRNLTGYIPFSVGKRSCAGESLARMEIFLFSVALIQRFRFKMANTPPSLMGHFGVTLTPKPFEMVAESLA